MPEENVRKQFSELHDSIEKTAQNFNMPGKIESLQGFFIDSWKSLKFVLSEKENILFGLLQLVAIGLGYYIWVQIIGWIPQEVWDQIGKEEKSGDLMSIVFVLWGFVCVGLVAYPIGILTACMSASYTLRSEGRESTILECLKIVLKRSWPLWVFSWFDGWLTVNRILDRLPKKKDRTPRAVKILRELVYQVWKISTLGIIPALVYGRSVSESCKDSLQMLKQFFLPLGKLRGGYSLICWIIGIGSYLSMFILFPYICEFQKSHNISGIYTFYLVAGIPILISLFFVLIIFRPLYIVSSTRIYLNFAKANQIERRLPDPSSKGLSAFVGFIAVAIIILTIILFRNQLGITYILEHNI